MKTPFHLDGILRTFQKSMKTILFIKINLEDIFSIELKTVSTCSK